MQFDYDEKIDAAIGKSVKSALRFYNELRKGAEARGERAEPPSFETFSSMSKGLMEASKQVDRDKIKNASMRDLFERTWSQKLLNYSTQRLLRETHDTLLKKY